MSLYIATVCVWVRARRTVATMVTLADGHLPRLANERRRVGQHRLQSSDGKRRCARCAGVGGYLVARECGVPVWLCALHYKVWAELRKAPARQRVDGALWRIRWRLSCVGRWSRW
jgi:hypothetical protein